MTRRPAVTLMEVLIAMFIMAIGMMALLALFPVGAVSMATALKDDRCAYASLMAENVAIATNVRYGDVNVLLTLNNPLLAPQGLVYVDPYGFYGGVTLPAIGSGVLPSNQLIQRISPSFVGSTSPFVLGSLPLIDRWFSLPDDITYTLSGGADITSGQIDRGRRYSYAYLLRRDPPVLPTPSKPFQSSIYSVQLYAVVYLGRPVRTPTLETTLPLLAPGVVGTNSITLNTVGTTIKRGGWVLDPINGYFYRVTNLAEFGGTTTVELQQNLVGPYPITYITIMDYVAEVFDKGYGWQQ